MLKKDEVVRKIKDALELTSLKEAARVFDGVANVMCEIMKEGEGVTLPGIGKFEVVTRAPHKGRNPQSGEEIDIPERKSVKFKASNTLKENLNK